MPAFKFQLISVAAVSLFISVSLRAEVLEEIIVTAQKREQNVQDVGVSVTAFTGKQMEDLGFVNAQQVTMMAPGVNTVQPNGEANYALGIRGVATSDFTTNVESPVAMYLDEVYISQMSGSGFMLYDMERVEILRGPQGTLFGRNATGGLANFVSRKPTQEFEGYLKSTYGEYEQFKLEGAVGGGLTDTISARLSGSYHENDGYIDNRLTGTELNNADDQSYRLHVLWTPTEDIDLLLTGRYAKQDIDTGFFENVSSVIPGELTPSQPNPVLDGYRDNDHDVYAGDYNRDGFNELDTDGVTATVKWSLGDTMTLTSVTDKSRVERHYIEDSDASPVSFFSFFLNTDAEQTSQELRLDGVTGPWTWVVGAYWLDLDIDDNNGGITDPFVGPAATPGAEAGLLNPYTRTLESLSAFGQVEYAINEQWTVIAGARAIRDENDFEYSTNIFDFINPNARNFDSGSNLANRVVLATYEGSREDTEWSGRLQLNWTPNDDLLLYTSLNRGVRGGGYNAPIFPLTVPYTDEVMSYDPEQLDAIEFGFKSALWDGTARLNGAVYYYDYSDYQAFFIVGIDTITFNTDAESQGAELELTLLPIDGLELLLGGAYNDIDVELPGGDVPSVQSPKWMANAMARYEFALAGGSLALQAAWLWRDEHFFALTGLETVRENGYDVTNLSATYTLPGNAWRVSAFVDNAFDEEYIVQTFDLSGPTVFGMTEQYYGRPRWWGLSVSFDWGA
jgi:iron complex outermembrane receptor protein